MKKACSTKIFKIKNEWVKEAYVNSEEYGKKYKESINENEFFWAKEGKRIDWIRQYTKIKDVKFSNKEVKIKWFYDGTLNASSNCIDRHLDSKGDKVAIIWEADDPNISKKITYKHTAPRRQQFHVSLS